MSGIDGILAGYEILRAGQEALYQDLHQHPEPSHHEHRTARCVAGELQKYGAELLRLMDTTPVPCGASTITARRSGPYGYRRVPGWKSTPAPTSSTHTREPSYLAGRLSALDARLEDAHMGCSMQAKA